MPVETQTLPGVITQGVNGEELGRGWCIVVYEMAGQHLPLDEWRGEIAVDAETAARLRGSDDLYIRFHPYGGVYDPWHGRVTVEPVGEEDDPAGRRLRLRGAGPLVRSRYTPDELRHGFPTAVGETEEEPQRG
ncbi:MAG TPA: hypothetical protein PKA95_15980 [Thermomicrobiales bacterium]|nr:hypothetical protein [Thermomicrobiales bacterium]